MRHLWRFWCWFTGHDWRWWWCCHCPEGERIQVSCWKCDYRSGGCVLPETQAKEKA